MSIYELRRDYTGEPLTERDVDPDPFRQFDAWYAQAVRAQVTDPNAMTLATVAADGRPSARIVLLKGAGEDGLVFFTDHRSRKASEIRGNPNVALVFYWAELSRQVRVGGEAAKLDDAAADAYFRTRPRQARLAAWASHQSAVVESREALEARVAELSGTYPDDDVPKPPHWGGYRVVPDAFEFWQGRPGRLHDRIRYRRTADDGAWTVERLSP